MSSGGPDLFVICKKCGSEVSPYVTECPYCGTRLRKRAPRIDRPGDEPKASGRRSRRRRPAPPSLGRLRSGEIPGIRADRRPYATLVLVAISLVGVVFWRTGLIDFSSFVVFGPVHGEWWRAVAAPFAYESTGYALVALGAVAVFGWLLERRHGPLPVVLLFLAGGVGGALVAGLLEAAPIAAGGNGAALALLAAWALPDLRDLRAGREIEGDMIGAGVWAAALLALSLATAEANVLAAATGLVAGLVLGAPLLRLSAR